MGVPSTVRVKTSAEMQLHAQLHEQKRKGGKPAPFGVNSMRRQVLYRHPFKGPLQA